MMKRLFILCSLLLMLCGCTKISNNNINTLVNEIIKSDNNKYNEYRIGYKYYLPSGISIEKNNDFNVIFNKNNIKYYMYVDAVSYYYKVKKEYQINNSAFLSMPINNDEKYGYLEIIKKNNKYLIEIMYNYAKIEVIVKKDELSDAIIYSLLILSSIKYNDDIIKSMLEEDVLNYSEESFNIFDTSTSESNFLKVIEEFDNYKEEEVPDYDLIN